MTVDRRVHEARFRAMGSDAHLVVVGDRVLLDVAIARIAELESRWTRFVETSEISVLNDRAGERVEVSADTRHLVATAIQAWRLTGGGFDPTVLGDVIRAGYDRPFEEVARDAHDGASALRRGATGIAVDDRAVQFPYGVAFDPGGIGKGLAADLVANETMAAGAEGVCVNLGGDLRVLGRAPDGAWNVAVEHPETDAPIALVGIGEGAVATSTTLRRQWQVGERRRHHLIDPWTGEPSVSDVVLVTVVAGEAWTAETLAKAELLRGSSRVFDLVGGTGAEALAVTDDGRVTTTAGFARFLTGDPLPGDLALTTIGGRP